MYAPARQRPARAAGCLPDSRWEDSHPARRRNRRRLSWPARAGRWVAAGIPLLFLVLRPGPAPLPGRHTSAAAALDWPRAPVTRVAGLRQVSTALPGEGAEGEWVDVWTTAYCPNCPVCDTGDLTATGRSAETAGAAVAARGLRAAPLGSRVYLEGIGWLKVDDTGGKVGSDQIDVRLQSHRAARRWGRRRMRVFLAASG